MSELIASISLIPADVRLIARKNTNIAEATHFEENETIGRKLTLLGAIRGCVI
jgi:hypothetical protein